MRTETKCTPSTLSVEYFRTPKLLFLLMELQTKQLFGALIKGHYRQCCRSILLPAVKLDQVLFCPLLLWLAKLVKVMVHLNVFVLGIVPRQNIVSLAVEDILLDRDSRWYFIGDHVILFAFVDSLAVRFECLLEIQ